MRERYNCELTKAGKTHIISEVCETTGFSRKYVIKLLSGYIEYREHKGRGKTYGEKTTETLKKIWLEAGCPCLPYLKAQIGMWVDDYSTHVAVIDGATRAQLLEMSARTMQRALSGERRVKPGWSRANKNSGWNQANEIKRLMPAASGEKVMACDVPPGDTQADTFALGGGNAAGSFFWILDLTDRKTQWTELSPAWNRGRHATLEALKRILGRFPFAVRSIHSDNGGEILNHHLMAFMNESGSEIFFWRSRPSKCNDNAHVEEKNKSAGRELFGETRLDCRELEPELIPLCEMWSDYTHFFKPCKMLTGKEKRKDGKGWKCTYDEPQTPYQRLLKENTLTEEEKARLEARKGRLSGIELMGRIKKKLKRVMRMQAEYAAATRVGNILMGGAGTDSALRAAPSGTSFPCASHKTGASDKKRGGQRANEKKLGAQYLANQKPPNFLQGALPI